MRRIAHLPVAILMLVPATGAAAQEWQALKGDQIRVALEGQTVVYSNGAVQDFRASGRTLYNAGRDSWGYWRVVGDQYCSQWPPSDLWACYDVEIASKTLRFIGSSGEVSDGVLN